MILAPAIDIEPFITTGGLILIAVVTAYSAIQVALINTGRKHLKAIREQTENNHQDASEDDITGEKKIPNLRENIDINQSQIMDAIRLVSRTVGTVLEMQHTTNTKVDNLYTITSGQRVRIEDIEDTITKKSEH